jgi:hypothetical protein
MRMVAPETLAPSDKNSDPSVVFVVVDGPNVVVGIVVVGIMVVGIVVAFTDVVVPGSVVVTADTVVTGYVVLDVVDDIDSVVTVVG